MDDSHAFIEPKLEVKTEDGIDRTGILINNNIIKHNHNRVHTKVYYRDFGWHKSINSKIFDILFS